MPEPFQVSDQSYVDLGGTELGYIGQPDASIELANGLFLNLVRPHPSAITLDAIAQGLANTCRYAGQVRRFYSVAEHAVLVAAKLHADGAPPHVVHAGLHHDDSEAFIHDVTRPFKTLLPAYRDIDERVSVAIAEALGLPQLVDLADREMVKAADDWALACETHHLLPSRGRGWFCDGLYNPTVEYGLRFSYDQLGREPERARELWLRWHETEGHGV